MWLQKGRGVANEWLWTCRLVSIGSIGSHFEIRGVGGRSRALARKMKGVGGTVVRCYVKVISFATIAEVRLSHLVGMLIILLRLLK